MSDAKKPKTSAKMQTVTLTVVYGRDELQRPAPLKVCDIKQLIVETYGCHLFTLGVYTKKNPKVLQDFSSVQAGEVVYVIVDKHLHELWAQQRQEWKLQWCGEHYSRYWLVMAQIDEFAAATVKYVENNFDDGCDAHEFADDKDYDEWVERWCQKWYFKTNPCRAYSVFDNWIVVLLKCYVEK